MQIEIIFEKEKHFFCETFIVFVIVGCSNLAVHLIHEKLTGRVHPHFCCPCILFLLEVIYAGLLMCGLE